MQALEGGQGFEVKDGDAVVRRYPYLCAVSGDGKAMGAGNHKRGCVCWVCDRSTADRDVEGEKEADANGRHPCQQYSYDSCVHPTSCYLWAPTTNPPPPQTASPTPCHVPTPFCASVCPCMGAAVCMCVCMCVSVGVCVWKWERNIAAYTPWKAAYT